MITRLILLLFLLAPATAVAANGKTWPVQGSDKYAALPNYEHLQYFGFYASAMGHWNFTGDLAEFTNLTWIHLGSRDDPGASIEAIVNRVGEAREAGVQAVLSIEPFLFTDRRGTLRLDSEIDDLLRQLRARIEDEGLLDTVAMIYPKDEPFREFVHHRDPGYWDQYVTGDVYEDVHADLLHANERIGAVFPGIPIGVILSGYDLHHEFFSIPDNYDWVGFNCYASMFRGCEDRKTIVNHYERLIAFMQPHQRLIAVPETWARNDSLDEADWPRVLSRRLQHHYEIALSEPRFIAFVPFIWSFETDNEVPGQGLNRFSALYDDGVDDIGSAFVEQVIEIGLQIKHGTHRYPNLAWYETEDHRRRPLQNVRGGVSAIDANGQLLAWAVDDALPHKNLRVQFYIRDSRGRLIHRSPLQRTDRIDHGLGVATTIGLHGVGHALPENFLQRHGKQPLTVDLRVFEDGENAQIIFEMRVVVSLPSSAPSVVMDLDLKSERRGRI